ncbi:MAG: MBL fold metallo-hydrolase [Candidatus Nanoarchaeia archaeon]|nr:MBL fold metallo-hydrolase [Candidatus Nanoarchaeia archaeon]MDD5239251.1 MBL fold metallo-hydrolase [Candidatus Nanoarchaeia archaeon]
MNKVKILFVGKHDRINEGKSMVASTSTLVRGDKNIIVDTGSFMDRDRLVDSLKKENLTPEDIDCVIITHTHLDHSANAGLFKNAEILVKHNLSNPGIKFYVNSYFIEKVNLDGYTVMKGVKTLLTPGHTVDNISVAVETREGTIVVAGDAISSEKYLDLSRIPESCWDKNEYNKSRKKILKIADWIIPGHGDLVKIK